MMLESALQNKIRLQAVQDGILLMRNNSGALQDKTGRLVRFGLGNESQATNKTMKSADLVGVRPMLIQQHHVGLYVGQFLAVEVKTPGNKQGERFEAQLRWSNLINQWGGAAGVVDTVAEARQLWGKTNV